MNPPTEFQPAAPRLGDRLGNFAQNSKRARGLRAYSRFVNMMKLILPTVALVLIILVVAWPHIDAEKLGFRIGVTMLKLSGSDDPSMINPRYVGTDSDDQPFSITADLAQNITASGTSITLIMPKADITLDDGTWLVLTANEGMYARVGKTLNLLGSVNLYHDSGYEFATPRAKINLATGSAESSDPVRGQGPFGQLVASGFRVVNKGKVIHFLGKSKLPLHPGAASIIQ